MPLTEQKRATSLPAGGTQGGSQQATATTGPYYDQDIRPIFEKNCAKCHGPNAAIPNWMDYSIASAKRHEIMERAVIKRDMPLGGKLEENEIQLIKKWIENGAPKGPENISVASPKLAQATSAAPTPQDQSASSTSSARSLEPLQIAKSIPFSGDLICKDVIKYPDQDVEYQSNFTAHFSDQISASNIIAFGVALDKTGRTLSATLVSFLGNTSLASKNPVLCNTNIENVKSCVMVNQIHDQQNAEFQILCKLHEPVLFRISMVNGVTNVSCKTSTFIISSVFKNCSIR